MSRWLQDLAKLQRLGDACVAVTVVSTRGSVPREAGTRMLVTREQVLGTIGGGHLEFKAISIAREMLAGVEQASMRRFPLGASLGQCCGGLVTLLFEPVAPTANWVGALNQALARGERCEVITALTGNAPAGKLMVCGAQVSGTLGGAGLDRSGVKLARTRSLALAAVPPALHALEGVDCFAETLKASDFQISLFGAGHVGRALVRILADLDCRIAWIDSREEAFPADLPDNVTAIISDAPEAEVARMPSGSYVLVMTHSHPQDQLITEAILRRGDFTYFGLIGSVGKRRLFEKRLALRGILEARFSAMICPIGIPAIRSKEPMAIAVAVAAELIERRDQQASSLHSGGEKKNNQCLARLSGQKWPAGRASA